MTTPGSHATPQRSPDVVIVESSPDALVVSTSVPTRIVLNGTARALWELCDGATSVEEMTGAVTALFDTDGDTARAEVALGLRDLHDAGLVTW